MPRFGLAGAFFTPQSLIADNQRLVNLYPEVIESGAGRSGAQLYLLGTPGLKTLWNVAHSPARGMITIPRFETNRERVFAVYGHTLHELLTDGSVRERGDVQDSSRRAYFAWNGNQLAVTSGERLYIVDLQADTLAGPILDTEGDVVSAGSVVQIDGYFLTHVPGTQQIRFSAINDGTVWDPLDVVEASAEPDRVTRLMAVHKELWALGDQTLQPFIDTGDPDAPWQPVQSGVIQQGVASPDAAVSLDNGILFLGRDPERGGPTAWRTQGYSVQQISSKAIDHVFSGYSPNAVEQAWGFAFVDDGHPVWHLNFIHPDVNRTWRYDASLPMPFAWYEVGDWNPATADFDAHLGIVHTFGFGKHIVGTRS
jgi:hypothetical protein